MNSSGPSPAQALCDVNKCNDSCACPSSKPTCLNGKCLALCQTNKSCTTACYCPADTNKCFGGLCKVGGARLGVRAAAGWVGLLCAAGMGLVSCCC